MSEVKANPMTKTPSGAAVSPGIRVMARFYRRMRPRRVFPLTAELRGNATGLSPLLIHPVIPGAQVAPADLPLDPGKASRATFYVTPLAQGALKGARLEIRHQGQLVQEMPLRMRSVTQSLTWVLAALTILVPAFLLWFTYYRPLTGYLPRTIAVANPPPSAEDSAKAEKLEKLPKEDAKVAEKPAAAAGDETRLRVFKVAAEPGQILEREIKRHVPNAVTLPGREEPYPFPFAVTEHVASALGTAYTYATHMVESHLSFWVGVALLAGTIISAILHRPARGRRTSQPLAL